MINNIENNNESDLDTTNHHLHSTSSSTLPFILACVDVYDLIPLLMLVTISHLTLLEGWNDVRDK